MIITVLDSTHNYFIKMLLFNFVAVSMTAATFAAAESDSKLQSRGIIDFIYDDDNYYGGKCSFPVPFKSDPLWFDEDRRLKKLYSCEVDNKKNSQRCDYTEVAEKLKSICQRRLGTFYTLTGKMTCRSSEWEGINLPYCAIDCDIDQLIDDGYFSLDSSCINEVEEVITHPVCFAPKPFKADPYWWVDDSRYKNLYSCNVDEATNTKTCDYTDTIEEFKEPCQQLGGTFYSLSGSVTCPSESWDVQKFPFCVSSDCDIQELISDGIFAPDENCSNDIEEVINHNPLGVAPGISSAARHEDLWFCVYVAAATALLLS